ncbi:Ktr system potassium uptake protein A [Polystyrenella longa]|uniref:Ktr system potassium uptake protein A n=1 Tax=Polystyrenella longa TaxID=2528007 RepID=A0A518CNX3_9PLAN|nr:TrkA family potassium uptake protein [Polystyrenella longa]QDU80922.1 Ktr system potassium uptake protein A [Polystyrenella longa]
MPRIAVLGLGRFGYTLATELAARKAEVIAVDHSPTIVEQIKDNVDLAVRLDATDELALRSQKIDEVDIAIVAIGGNFESALLATTILNSLEIPQIICRARTKFHAEIFKRIGASQVIQPEKQAGEEMARKLALPHLRDLIPLEEGFSLIELDAPGSFVGKSLLELKLRETYNLNLVGIRNMPVKDEDAEDGEGIDEAPRIMSVPKPHDIINSGDTLYIVGPDARLAQLPRE